jgi:methylphosphotriester-DNA--protein-cysteine methyltransferase
MVAHALDQGGMSVERAAMDFGYPSAPALRNLCKRYTGLRWSEVRRHGGLAYLVERFSQTLRRGTACVAKPVA